MTSDLSTENKEATAMQKNPNRPLWMGVVLILLGLAAVVVPVVSTIVAETWIAVILIMAGSTKLIYAFQTREQGGFVWKLLLSILYLATAIMLFIYPLTSIITLTLLLGSYLLTEGVFELILAFRLRPQPNWTWVLSNGFVTLLLGGLILFQWPFNAPWLIGTLVGASVFMTGLSRVMLALRHSDQSGRPEQPAPVA
uniref:HdeD family acid-resistance protein n=1 Tax=Cyanothece sp. (strain PCC 7425 / ATCC 29141) TaxID=395961 RepID=B8HLT7_CYAP4